MYTTVMSGRARQQLLHIGSLVVLLFAIAPNVLYIGHWGIIGGRSDMANEAEVEEHAAHCHVGPSKCSDAVGTGQVLPGMADALLLLGGALLALAAARPASEHQGFPARFERPPRGTIRNLAT